MIVAGALLAATLLVIDAGVIDAGVADAGEAGASRRRGAPTRRPMATPDVPPPAPPPVGRVAGRVLAKGTRAPVVGASLTADVTDVGATDADGGFDVELPCGRRRLTVQAPGFERLTTEVNVCDARRSRG